MSGIKIPVTGTKGEILALVLDEAQVSVLDVRGFNDREIKRLVNTLIWGSKADIICLQNTKLEGNVLEMAKQMWGVRWVGQAYLATREC